MGVDESDLAWYSLKRSSVDFLAARELAAKSVADRKAGSQRILRLSCLAGCMWEKKKE